MAYGFKVVSGAEFSSMIELPAQNGQALAVGDPVFLENDGGEATVDLAAAGEPIYGTVLQALTGDGTTKVQILKAHQNITYEIDNDNDTDTFGTTADRGAGNYFNITGASGAVQVDTSTGTTVSANKQLVCVKENPDAGDVSLGHFKVVASMIQG